MPALRQRQQIAELNNRISEIRKLRDEEEGAHQAATLTYIDRQRAAIASARSVLESLCKRWSSRKGNDRSWDYFISYPRPDRDLALDVFRAIERTGCAFIDYVCLVPSDNWDARIPSIQDVCKVTIAIITPNSPTAHYHVSEIKRAINLYRNGSHRVIPLFFPA